MSDCKSIRFGYNNRVPECTLSSNPTASTPIDYIKNELGARLSVWPVPDSSGNITITGVSSSTMRAQFVAICGVKLVGDVELKLELFLATDLVTDLLQMDYVPVIRRDLSPQVAIDEWSAGDDTFGANDDGGMGSVPDTFVHWLDESMNFDRWRLTIRRSALSSVEMVNVKLRMVFMGDMLELNDNFSYDNAIRFVGDPKQKQTAGGSWASTRRPVLSKNFRLVLARMEERDYERFQQFESSRMGRSFIVCPFPGSSKPWIEDKYNMLARFGAGLDFQHSRRWVRKTSVTLLEV